jgi:hypothetical protein
LSNLYTQIDMLRGERDEARTAANHHATEAEKLKARVLELEQERDDHSADATALREVLRHVKIRIAFVGHPGEPWRGDRSRHELLGENGPDWSDVVERIERVLAVSSPPVSAIQRMTREHAEQFISACAGWIRDEGTPPPGELADAIATLRRERDAAIAELTEAKADWVILEARWEKAEKERDAYKHDCDVAMALSLERADAATAARAERDEALRRLDKTALDLRDLRGNMSSFSSGYHAHGAKLEADIAAAREGERAAQVDRKAWEDEAKAHAATLKLAAEENGRLRAEVARLMDGMEAAWGVIANAGRGDWTLEHPEWQKAAARWRDEHWHPALKRTSGTAEWLESVKAEVRAKALLEGADEVEAQYPDSDWTRRDFAKLLRSLAAKARTT